MNLKAIINRIKGDGTDLNSLCALISRHRDIFVYLFYLAVLLTAYAPVFTNVYAYSDDFPFFLEPDGNSFEFYIRQGRIAHGLAMLILSHFAFSIEDLIFIRLIGLFGIIISACFLYHLIMKLKIFHDNIYLLIFIPLWLFLLPSVQVLVGWTILFHTPSLSILLALMSYYLIRLAQNESIFAKKILKTVLSLLCIIISFSDYQITAMIFIIPMISEFCLSRKRTNLKEFAYPFIVLCIGMLSSLIMVKIMPLLFHLQTAEGRELNLSILTMFQWLRSTPLTLSIQNYSLFDSPSFTAISKIFIISGYIAAIITSDDWKTRLFKALAIPSLIIFSILPNALTARGTEYRVITILAMATTILLLYGFINIGFIVFKSLKKEKLFFLAPLFLTFILSIAAQGNIVQRYVLPFNVEYHAFAAELSKLPKDSPVKIALFSDNYESIYVHLRRTADFGIANISIDFAAPAFIEMVIANKGFSNISLYENPFIENKKDIPKASGSLYIIDVNEFITGLQIKHRNAQ